MGNVRVGFGRVKGVSLNLALLAKRFTGLFRYLPNFKTHINNAKMKFFVFSLCYLIDRAKVKGAKITL
jgi:hypothetical protein